jgi:hypothetical protein
LLLPLGSQLRYYPFMRKSIKVIPKKRGRPATGKDPVTALRLSPELRSAIDTWRAAQPDAPTRSEAIRRLLEKGLGRAAPKSEGGSPFGA